MRFHRTAFTEMLRCTLRGHLRNRLAVFLAVAFIPAWITVARVCASDRPVRFPLDSAGVTVLAPAHHVGQVANALAAVTLVTGFTMFMETFKAGEVDRRLLLAGYPRLPLLMAKVTAVALVAALLALYTTAVLWASCPCGSRSPWASPSSAPAWCTAASASSSARWCAASWRGSSSSSCSAWSTPDCRTRSSTSPTWPA